MSIGVDGFKAATPENIWYNGCYTCTEYIQAEYKDLDKESTVLGLPDAKLFDSVTIKMVESVDTAYQPCMLLVKLAFGVDPARVKFDDNL